MTVIDYLQTHSKTELAYEVSEGVLVLAIICGLIYCVVSLI